MKQLALFICLLVLCISCKKESGKQKDILLSEISTDGVVRSRLYYAADNKLVKVEHYSANVLNSYFALEYDNKGNISKLSSFIEPGNIPAVRIIFQTDAEGKISSTANYDLTGPAPNTPTSLTTYFYNPQGLMIKLERRDNNNELLSSINLLYFPDGNLKELQTFKKSGNQLWMSAKSVYSIPNGFYPKGVEQLRKILGPDFTAGLFSESIQMYTYDQNGGMLTHKSRLMSGRTFNEDGSVKKQVETYKSIKPSHPEEVTHVAYSYIFQ